MQESSSPHLLPWHYWDLRAGDSGQSPLNQDFCSLRPVTWKQDRVVIKTFSPSTVWVRHVTSDYGAHGRVFLLSYIPGYYLDLMILWYLFTAIATSSSKREVVTVPTYWGSSENLDVGEQVLWHTFLWRGLYISSPLVLNIITQTHLDCLWMLNTFSGNLYMASSAALIISFSREAHLPSRGEKW